MINKILTIGRLGDLSDTWESLNEIDDGLSEQVVVIDYANFNFSHG